MVVVTNKSLSDVWNIITMHAFKHYLSSHPYIEVPLLYMDKRRLYIQVNSKKKELGPELFFPPPPLTACAHHPIQTAKLYRRSPRNQRARAIV